MVVQIAASDVLEEEVDSVLVLEHVVHAKNEWVVRLEKDILLVLRVLYLVLIYEYVFIYPLHCIESAIFFVYYQKDLSKRALVNHLSDLEVFQRILLFLLRERSPGNKQL